MCIYKQAVEDYAQIFHQEQANSDRTNRSISPSPKCLSILGSQPQKPAVQTADDLNFQTQHPGDPQRRPAYAEDCEADLRVLCENEQLLFEIHQRYS